MPSLTELAIPFLSGYRGREAQIQQEGMNELRQASVLMQLAQQQEARAAQQRAMQEDASFRAEMEAAAGDPVKLRDIAMRRAKPDDVLRATQPDKPTQPLADNRPEVLRLTEALGGLAENHPARPHILARLEALGPKPEKDPAMSPLGKLLAERDALPAGDPRRAIYDKAITEFKPGGGTSVTVSPTLQLGKEGGNKVDTGLLDTSSGLMRLSAIEGQFKPEYQQWMTRLGTTWSAVRESMGGTLNAADKQTLINFTAYKRNAINSLNEYIKSITGAAMSETEAQRILRGMPNPGQGITDGDSPTEFKAKLDDAMKQTKMALARYEYIKRNGMALTKADGSPVVPLERMPEIMNSRGRELEAQLKSQGITQEQIPNKVRGMLAKEFGLVQ